MKVRVIAEGRKSYEPRSSGGSCDCGGGAGCGGGGRCGSIQVSGVEDRLHGREERSNPVASPLSR